MERRFSSFAENWRPDFGSYCGLMILASDLFLRPVFFSIVSIFSSFHLSLSSIVISQNPSSFFHFRVSLFHLEASLYASCSLQIALKLRFSYSVFSMFILPIFHHPPQAPKHQYFCHHVSSFERN